MQFNTTIQAIFNDPRQAPAIVEHLTGLRHTPKKALKYINNNIGLGEIAELQEILTELNESHE